MAATTQVRLLVRTCMWLGRAASADIKRAARGLVEHGPKRGGSLFCLPFVSFVVGRGGEAR